jgi:hypothetical protein
MPVKEYRCQVQSEHYIMSARTELARLVLQAIKDGHSVSTGDAMQLRSWAVIPKDAVLSLEAIAL